MRPIKPLAILGALALTLAACSSSAQLTDETSTTTSAEPAATVTAGPVGAASEPSPSATPSPTATATVTASPTPTPDLLVELAEELTRLGISDTAATCIRERLAQLSADRDAFEAAAPDAAALLDQVAQSCEVDLLDYLEPADE